MLLDTMIYVLLILISIQFPTNFAWSINRFSWGNRKAPLTAAPLVAAPPSCQLQFESSLGPGNKNIMEGTCEAVRFVDQFVL
mgnify:CR=1 FL=1